MKGKKYNRAGSPRPPQAGQPRSPHTGASHRSDPFAAAGSADVPPAGTPAWEPRLADEGATIGARRTTEGTIVGDGSASDSAIGGRGGIEWRPDARPHARAFNRDLSWLEFNARVLHQAMDHRTPLLERVRFLAIFSSNLDEFVMKRVGFHTRCVEQGRRPEIPEGYTTVQFLELLRRRIDALEKLQADCFNTSIRPLLAAEELYLLDYAQLEPDERRRIDDWYRKNVFPVLTPLAVDPGHRFPFVSNLSANLGVLLRDPGGEGVTFARVKIPGMIPQWVRIPPYRSANSGRGRFVALYDLIRNNLDDLFPGMQIVEVTPFRVTRSAATEEDSTAANADEPDNLLDFVEAQLRRRRFAKVVRLEMPTDASESMVSHVSRMLGFPSDHADAIDGLMEYRSLFEVADLPRPDLRFPAWTPAAPPRLAPGGGGAGGGGGDIFAAIREGDLLVHHPYESFSASAERFIAAAASDPDVLAIKQTLYRTSRDSPFVAHLIRAAESGKQVACLVEVRARFDESRNVKLAQSLEKAGVHVAYGVVGLKTHCKAALVVRREPTGLRSYAHIGTGNYNPSTAQLYTDLGLFTADPAITEDIVELFNLLTGRSRQSAYRSVLVAPATMRAGFYEMIDRETRLAREHAAGRSPVGGRIVAKVNALEDQQITQRLYAASRAGVRIHLFVRGFCCLRPGVPGLSENIRVTSVIGRFLEHSRLFHFGAGRADPIDGEWYIGSADWMHRNLDGRVEAVVPVRDAASRARLAHIVDVMARDRRCAWDLGPEGVYALRESPAPADADPGSPEVMGTFSTLMQDAAAAARRARTL